MTNKKRTTAGRRRSRRRSSAFGYHRRSIGIITFVLVLLICVLTVNAVKLQARNQDYKQQEAELKAQINEQKERSKEVKEYQKYVKTDEYIKEIAEEKLGLVDPDEIIFKPAG